MAAIKHPEVATLLEALPYIKEFFGKTIVFRRNRHGQSAVGLCGDDGSLFQVTKQLVPDAAGEARDLGYVGKIDRVDVDVLNHIAEDYIPVVASVGADSEGRSYNVNA